MVNLISAYLGSSDKEPLITWNVLCERGLQKLGFDAFPQAVSVIDIPWYINSRATVEHFVGYPLFRVYKGDTLLWSEGNYYAGQSYDVKDNPIVKTVMKN